LRPVTALWATLVTGSQQVYGFSYQISRHIDQPHSEHGTGEPAAVGRGKNHGLRSCGPRGTHEPCSRLAPPSATTPTGGIHTRGQPTGSVEPRNQQFDRRCLRPMKLYRNLSGLAQANDAEGRQLAYRRSHCHGHGSPARQLAGTTIAYCAPASRATPAEWPTRKGQRGRANYATDRRAQGFAPSKLCRPVILASRNR
jgi:hypothetical protein